MGGCDALPTPTGSPSSSATSCVPSATSSTRKGGYGYSTEHEIERLYRDAPMLLIGEGTAEIQKMIIGRALVKDYGR